MTLSEGDRGTIINCFKQFGWRGREICQRLKEKKWDHRTVDRNIKRYELSLTDKMKPIPGRPRTASAEQVENDFLGLTASQEEQPGTSKSLRKTSRSLGISRTTGSRISKRAKRKSVRRMATPQVPEGTVARRLTRALNLYTRYSNDRIKLLAWQDEADLTLQVRTNIQNNRIFIRGRKNDVNPDRLYHPGNKMSKKLMVSCLFSWNGMSKPFFINPQESKVNGKCFTKHLEKDLLPALNQLYPAGNGIYVQDGASSHTCSLTQNFLKEKLGRHGFVNNKQWPPKSPDLNPLDYHFWDALKEKVYEGRKEPFTSLDQLKRRVRRVWESANNDEHRKRAILQFRK